MTKKKVLLMLFTCISVMSILLGGYRTIWNFTQSVENDLVFEEEAAAGALSFDILEGTGPLSIGDEGERVKELQRVLRELGYYEGELDSTYGMVTAEAVRNYQNALGITENGNAGIATLFALGLGGGEAMEIDEAVMLAAAIERYAGDEPFGTRTAVGAVILERARLLGTLSRGIAFYSGETAGRSAVDARSYAAAKAALMGISPAGSALNFSRTKPEGIYTKLGGLYFFN